MKYFPSPGQTILSGIIEGGTRRYCLHLISIIPPLLQMILQMLLNTFYNIWRWKPFQLGLSSHPGPSRGPVSRDSPCFCPVCDSFPELIVAGSQGSAKLSGPVIFKPPLHRARTLDWSTRDQFLWKLQNSKTRVLLDLCWDFRAVVQCVCVCVFLGGAPTGGEFCMKILTFLSLGVEERKELSRQQRVLLARACMAWLIFLCSPSSLMLLPDTGQLSPQTTKSGWLYQGRAGWVAAVLLPPPSG